MRTVEPHEETLALLPWYVSGTLAEDEEARVAAHLASCAACREEEAACRGQAAAVREAEPVALSPHPANFERLLARIDRAEPPRRSWRWLAGWPSSWREAPAGLRWAFAAQLAVIALLATLGPLARERGAPAGGATPLFHTLSSSPDVPAGAFTLRLLFSETITEAEIRRLLLPLSAEIVGGPSPLGAYLVRIPATADGVEVVLAHLRSQPTVRFAEAVARPAAETR